VKSAQAAKSQDFLLNVMRYLVVLLIVGAVLFLAWRSVKRSGVMTPVREPVDLREIELGDLTAQLDAAYERAQLPEGTPGDRAELEGPRSAVEQDLNDLIERQPDEVAQTLRSWLADRRT
jgi:flagellar M-ring protein FliF